MEPTRFAFTDLLNAMPDAILIVRRDGRIFEANVRAEGMFGYAREKLLGMSVDVLLPEAARDKHVGHRQRYADAPHVRPMGCGMELLGRHRDGSEFPVEISLSPYQSPDGQMVVSAIRSPRKQANSRTIEQANDEGPQDEG
jgi:protein-histidine pros-kinase